jgi:Xaa-Pro aminopeptidase
VPGFAERRERLRTRLEAAGVEGFVVSGLPSVRYLSGFTGSAAGLLILLDPPDVFVTDARYRTQIAGEIDPALEAVVAVEKPLPAIRALARERGLDRLAFERAHVSVAEWEAWRDDGAPAPVGADGWVEQLRAVKSPPEIVALQRAARIADHAFASILESVRPGIEERLLALELDRRLIEAGAEEPAFATIVAFGERAALPHARPTGRALRRGDVVLFDFGAVVDGYHSDLSRTVSFGPAGPEIAEAYDVVLAAQQAAIDGLRSGLNGREADELARAVIAEAGHGERFGHSLGHGIGLEVHETPRLSRTSEDLLEPHMVVTIEPGVYIEGIGGVRIEDDVVVGPHGVEVLTAAPKDTLITL